MKKLLKSSPFVIAAISVVVALVIILPWLLPTRESTLLRSVARVEATSCLMLTDGSRDTIYICIADGQPAEADFCADSVAVKREGTAVFVSNGGHALTSAGLLGTLPDTLAADSTQRLMDALQGTLETDRGDAAHVLREMDYYERTHSVADDGYNEMMSLKAQTEAYSARLDSTAHMAERLFASAEAGKRIIAAIHTDYRLIFNRTATADSIYTDTVRCKRLTDTALRDSTSLLLLQTADSLLPEGAARFAAMRFGTMAKAKRSIFFHDFGDETAVPLPAVSADSSDMRTFASAEGGAAINCFGRLCGIVVDGKVVGAEQIAAAVYADKGWLSALWSNFCQKIKSWFADRPTRRHTILYIYKQCARIVLPDGWTYEGTVAERKGALIKEGAGTLTDSIGNIYGGTWQADTLASGYSIAREGYYQGTFNAKRQPHGFGFCHKRDQTFYSGEWKEGQRHGHGISLSGDNVAKCGAWKEDVFKGERMVYSADRVYGIDISRYQHEIRRKKYPIHWNKLRITGLGPQKRIEGKVDYKVDFVYVKATQGTSIFSNYYAADIRAARRQGIAAGSYHFFSYLKSGAAQAEYFLKKASLAKGDLPPMLDVEPTESEIRKMGGVQKLFQEMLVWLRAVERRCGTKPVLYMGQNFVNKHMPDAPKELKAYDVWIARYSEFKPFVHLLHWQLTYRGRVSGITGNVDINVFNGNREQFNEYKKEHCIK
ncbi:MAG: GH25 family lysozyme [Alloprevotella sp.]